MARVHLPWRDHPRGICVGLSAVLLLATLLLLVASAFSAPAAQTIQPVGYLPLVKLPPRYRIAFVSTRDGSADIYVMNADGSSQTRLSDDHIHGTLPVWSPDGRQIAFLPIGGSPDIYVMNADGSSQTKLALGGNPVWSPTIN
jgi:hypothetical protein